MGKQNKYRTLFNDIKNTNVVNLHYKTEICKSIDYISKLILNVKNIEKINPFYSILTLLHSYFYDVLFETLIIIYMRELEFLNNVLFDILKSLFNDYIGVQLYNTIYKSSNSIHTVQYL